MATSSSAQLNPFTIHIFDLDNKIELSLMAVYSIPFTVGQTVQIVDDFITGIPFSEKPFKMYEVVAIRPIVFSKVKGEGITSKDNIEFSVDVRQKSDYSQSENDY